MPLAKCLLYHMQSSSCKKKWISLGRYLSRWSESVFLNHPFWSACSHSVVTANGSPCTHRHPLFTLLDFVITTLLMHQDFVAFGYMTQRPLPKPLSTHHKNITVDRSWGGSIFHRSSSFWIFRLPFQMLVIFSATMYDGIKMWKALFITWCSRRNI